jgi:hypothetical protein
MPRKALTGALHQFAEALAGKFFVYNGIDIHFCPLKKGPSA